MPVTTRTIIFLVGDPYRPSFATVTGKIREGWTTQLIPGSSVRDPNLGVFIRDLFRGENVTFIWVIKGSLGRSWYCFVAIYLLSFGDFSGGDLQFRGFQLSTNPQFWVVGENEPFLLIKLCFQITIFNM